MGDESRGISEVLGYVFVLTLVLTTVVIVSVAGLGELQEVRNREQLTNAERAFELLTNNIDDVAQRGAPSRATEMNLENAQIAVADPVEFTFHGLNSSNSSNNFNETYTVWPIQYRSGNRPADIAYVGGAVFRSARRGVAVLHEPPIIAESDRLVFPLIHTRSRTTQSRSGGTTQIRTEHATTTLLASDMDGTYDTVFVNVTTPRAAGWEEILDSRSGVECELETGGSTDRVWCKATNPTRLHIALVQVDVIISS